MFTFVTQHADINNLTQEDLHYGKLVSYTRYCAIIEELGTGIQFRIHDTLYVEYDGDHKATIEEFIEGIENKLDIERDLNEYDMISYK